MTRLALIAALTTITPAAAFALPSVGDVVGTNPADAEDALELAGCKVRKFEAEGGKIEAKCADAQGKHWEVYIDPASGVVTKIKLDD